MSSSDPSHAGFRFDLSEPDDDGDSTGSHGDFDDMPDDDDDEEDDDDDDDDDMEDEDDDDDDVLNSHIRPHVLNVIASAFSASGYRAALHSDAPPPFPNQLTPLSLSDFSHMPVPDAPFLLPSRRVGMRSGDLSNLSSHFFLDSFDSLPTRNFTQLLSAIGGSIRLRLDTVAPWQVERTDPSLLFTYASRLSSGMPMCDSRVFAADLSLRGTASAIHPMLLRPPTPPAGQHVVDATRSLFSTLTRATSAERSPLRPLSHSTRQPQVRVSQAMTDVSGYITAAAAASDDQDASERPPPPIAVSTPQLQIARAEPTPIEVSADTSMASGSSAPSRGGAGPSSSVATEDSVEAAEPSSVAASPADSGLVAPRRDTETAPTTSGARAHGTGSLSSSRDQVDYLAECDLVRSVEPMQMPGPLDFFSGHVPRGGRHSYDRLAHSRDRDRDKIPSGVLKRWVYDPPSFGGDNLPAMFGNDLAHRSGRGHGRSPNPNIPLLAPESHEAVNTLSTRIMGRLETLLTEMTKIDEDVAERERREEVKKETEKEKAEAEKKKAEEEEEAREEETSRRAAEPSSEVAQAPANEEVAIDSNDVSAVAAHRAAAAGISLDAPANRNPEVVEAAIASTGIDPAYLAALPDEMRADIFSREYERIYSTAREEAGTSSSPASTTTVPQVFLIALPPALRAEVLELEVQFQQRQQNASGSNGTGPGANGNREGSGPAGAAEMDNATFLATLAPELRADILRTSADADIQSLPPSAAAEARELRARDSNARMLWPESGILGFEGRRFTNGLRGHGQGRHGSRSTPKQPPAYRWKKVEYGWLRESPKAADEPTCPLKADGLSALIQMHLLRRGHYGKTSLYHVFSQASKNTEARELILKQLVELLTSSLFQDARQREIHADKHMGEDFSRQHGTTARRALEMLTLLCKNDRVVAENLLGLPKSNQELGLIPKKITESTTMSYHNGNTSLATLVSLLDNPLFERSQSHMEQLVSLISILSLNLPPAFCDNSDPKRPGSLARLRRSISDLNDDIHESMTVLLDTHDDPQGIYHIADDGEDDDDDDDSEDDHGVFESPDIERQERSSRTRSTSNGDGAKKDKESVVHIPPQYRIPAFKREDLVLLTRVLLRSGCSEKTYERVSRSIGILGELVPIRIIFVESLVQIAVNAGQAVHEEYLQLIEALEAATGPQPKRKKRDVIASFSSASTANERTLLRVVESLAALWEHEAEEAAPKKPVPKAEDSDQGNNTESKKDAMGDSDSTPREARKDTVSTQSRFRPTMIIGLKALWSSLDRILELTSDEGALRDGKAQPSSSRSSLSQSTVLNVGRMKSAARTISPILARLSAMIEAFLITHTAKDPTKPGENLPPPSPRSPGSPTLGRIPSSPRDATFAPSDGDLAAFVERHRVPINALLHANPSLLESSFKGALRHPQAIDFDNKKAYFRNVIKKRSSEAHAGTIRLNDIRRERVFDDSYTRLRKRTPEEMKGRLHVQFKGEEGVDAGGVTREWYIVLARQIFDPNYVLFTRSAAKAATYQPDKRSYFHSEHLENFRFVGRIIGKAIYDGQLLDAYFTRSFYKHILGLKPTYHDIEAQDPEYYRSLKWMMENDITGVLDYTMSAEYDEFGKQSVVDLVPNGREIPVTEENKGEYVRLVTEVRMTKTIEKQIEAFKKGFYELIPCDDIKIFNELELELLMSGLPDIDMADLKANVEYTGYTASSPQVTWFWRCVSNMDQEDLARLVMFVTGTSKVPLEGFGTLQGMNGLQKFQIHRVSGNTMRLPSAHTCFNQMDLPEYSSAEILSERLLRAVRECSVGFGFA